MRVTFFFEKKKVTKEKTKTKGEKVNDSTYRTWLYSVIFHISSFYQGQDLLTSRKRGQSLFD